MTFKNRIKTTIGLLFFIMPFFLKAQSPQDFRITANFQEESLVSIFESIEKMAPVRFYFSEEKLPKTKFSGKRLAASNSKKRRKCLYGGRDKSAASFYFP